MQHDTPAFFDQYVLRNYGRFPVSLARGEGSRVWDEDGREYLDFCTGIAVCSLGHCHPAMTRALAEQAATLVHVSNLYYNRPQADAARRLVEIVGHAGRVFFCNSGAEANEALYKVARKFGNTTRPPEAFSQTDGAPEILTFTNSFHGRTLAGIAATAQEKVKLGFAPPVAGFRHLPFNDVNALESAISPATVAILLEIVQAEGGVHVATPEFLRAARRLCDKHNLLLMLDEVQCGLARCGELRSWHAVGASDIAPDVISWAKGLGGGFPIGAVWFGDRAVQTNDGEAPLYSLLGPGTHGTTYGGSPLGASVVNTVLDIIETDDLSRNARERGAQAIAAVNSLNSPFVRSVRGKGLLIGIELDADRFAPHVAPGSTPALELTNRLIAEGLLVPPAGPNVIRWLPPLNVSSDEIDRAAEKLGSALAKIR